MMQGICLLKRPNMPPEIAVQNYPRRAEGYVIVQPITVGLCRTDLLIADEKIKVNHPVILGHEFSARVLEVGENSRLNRGDIVAVDPTRTRKDGSDDFMGRDFDGALATWACLPEGKLYRIEPGVVSAKQAAYLEPVAAALGGVEEAVRIGGNGAILGSNRIADLTALCFSTYSGKGALNLGYEQIRSDIALGKGLYTFDWLIETRLEPDIMQLALKLLKVRGALILKSRHAEAISLPAIRWAERQLIISARSRADFTSSLQWLLANKNSINPLLGEEFALENWQAAFACANGGEMGKTFVSLPE